MSEVQFDSNRLAPVRIHRFLSSRAYHSWFVGTRNRLESEFPKEFRPRGMASLTIANLRAPESLPQAPQHVPPTNGGIRRFAETQLPESAKSSVKARVRWGKSICNNYATHIVVSLGSPEIENEVLTLAEGLRSIGYYAVKDLAEGLHLSLGTFPPNTRPNRKAYEILTDAIPEEFVFEPVSVLNRYKSPHFAPIQNVS